MVNHTYTYGLDNGLHREPTLSEYMIDEVCSTVTTVWDNNTSNRLELIVKSYILPVL